MGVYDEFDTCKTITPTGEAADCQRRVPALSKIADGDGVNND